VGLCWYAPVGIDGLGSKPARGRLMIVKPCSERRTAELVQKSGFLWEREGVKHEGCNK